MLSRFTIFLVFLLFTCSESYDPVDPFGNVTITWDVMSWTTDGYVASVSIHNYQMYRHITSPGWTLGWSWAKNEIIWNMVGAEATEQGDCTKFKGDQLPHSCMTSPAIIDLLPGVPYNQQVHNCCKGGELASVGQDASSSVSSFLLTVGHSSTSTESIRLPENYTLLAPGLGYTCGAPLIVPSAVYPSPNGRRRTQALISWTVVCSYSQTLASQKHTCCVSLSSFYNEEITPCPVCSCGCLNEEKCIMSQLDTKEGKNTPHLQCTRHMCPIRVHWHVMLNYNGYWRVKITITNFDYGLNYTEWTLVAQHPNMDKVYRVFSFNYRTISPINDTAMFYGINTYNDILQAGGIVQTEMIFQKDKEFSLEQGWAFPRKIYFNGDVCELPPPDAYPRLPNSAANYPISLLSVVTFLLIAVCII